MDPQIPGLVTVKATEMSAPPAWALMQRKLFSTMEETARLAHEKYARPRHPMNMAQLHRMGWNLAIPYNSDGFQMGEGNQFFYDFGGACPSNGEMYERADLVGPDFKFHHSKLDAASCCGS